ncbi:hypothetical protein ALT721_1090003 [Alteromonas alvinellae]
MVCLERDNQIGYDGWVRVLLAQIKKKYKNKSMENTCLD